MRNVGMGLLRTVTLATAVAGLGATAGSGLAADATGVINTYADIAHAGYEDSL